MTVQDETIAKIRQLPESLVREINDFVDFLVMRHASDESPAETLSDHAALRANFTESLEMAESDFSNYLDNLEDYEKRLARGEIRW